MSTTAPRRVGRFLLARRRCLPIVAVLSLLVIASCSLDPSGGEVVKFPILSPYQALSEAEIVSIGADGFTGDDEAIAQAILDWQDSHMSYDALQPDSSYPMRWNHILPGIYPVGEMIVNRTVDDGGTEKIYGVCWDYAAIYNAIAAYYGLQVRVSAWKEYMSGTPGGETGMGPDEYDALVPFLLANGLSFSYDQVREAARETYQHYRAEVFLNGAWTAFDGTGPTGEYANDANYTEAPWDEAYSAALATP